MEATAGKAGWEIPEWCAGAGMARPTYYTLPAEARPAMVNIGRKVVITESPAAWLERVRQAGGVKLQKKKRATA
jgi:hypothetical protein